MKESRPVLLRALLPLFCLMLMAVTCFEDPEPEPEPTPEPQPAKEASLSVSPNGSVTFPAEGGDKEFMITCNTDYYGYSFSRRDWMEAKIVKERKSIVITLTPNMTKSARSNEVTFFGRQEGSEEHAVEVKVKISQPSAITNEPVETVSGKLDFGAKIETAGYKVTTILETTSVGNENAISVGALLDGMVPQPLLVSNASGEVVMMARDNFSSKSALTVNAHTTALALVTTQPLFAPVKGTDEFKTLTTMITSSKNWKAYENEVAALVKAGKPLLSSQNTALISALDALMDDICKDESVMPLTKAPTEILGRTNDRPFKVEISGKKVNIYNYGLTPMYEGEVWSEVTGEKVGSIDIPTADDYGITDIFLRKSFKWSGPITFDFNALPNAKDGAYTFFFSRYTDKAKVDFIVNYLITAMDIIGASVSSIGTTTLKQAATKWVVARGGQLMQMIMGGKYSFMEISEATFNAIFDFVSSEEFIAVCGIAMSVSVKAALKKINPVLTIYSGLRGGTNLMTRTYYMLDAPSPVEFTVCFQQKATSLTTCHTVKLEAASGNNQVGTSGYFLDQPLKIRIVDETSKPGKPKSYYLLFELLTEGELIQDKVFTNTLEGETLWRLGKKDRIQHVVVEALDVATGAVVSEEPLVFVATATDIKDGEESGNIPGWLQGTWVILDDRPYYPKKTYTFTARTVTFSSGMSSGGYTGLSVEFRTDKHLSDANWFEWNPEYYVGTVWFTCSDEDLPVPSLREVMAIYKPRPDSEYGGKFPEIIHICNGDDIAYFDGAYYQHQ